MSRIAELGRRARERFSSLSRRPAEIHPCLIEFMATESLDQKRAKIENVLRTRYAAESPDLTLDEVNRRIDLQLRASEIAEAQHAGQKRLTGEDYTHHPANVAFLTANDLNIDINLVHIAAGAAWTHDVLEDTDITPSEFKEKFGEEYDKSEVELVTAGAIYLSKKMEAPRERIKNEFYEAYTLAPSYRSVDQNVFVVWMLNDNKSEKARERGYWRDVIGQAPNWVKHIRVWDKCDNNLNIPEEHHAKTPDDSRRIAKIQRESFPDTKKKLIPFALKVGGVASLALAEALRRSMKQKRLHSSGK